MRQLSLPYDVQLLLSDLPAGQRHAIWRDACAHAKQDWRFLAGFGVMGACILAADAVVLRHVRHGIMIDGLVTGFAAYIGASIGEKFWQRVARRFVQRQLTLMGRCAACGYNLTGNASGVCPECGTAVPAEAKP
jgi:hypothetical protein